MKNKFIRFLLLSEAIVVLCCTIACETTGIVSKNTSKNSTYKIANSVVSPLEADLQISETRAFATVTGSLSEGVARLQSHAIQSLLQKAGADILLVPSVSVEDNSSTLTVTVSGYPGTYTHIRPRETGTASMAVSHPMEPVHIIGLFAGCADTLPTLLPVAIPHATGIDKMQLPVPEEQFKPSNNLKNMIRTKEIDGSESAKQEENLPVAPSTTKPAEPRTVPAAEPKKSSAADRLRELKKKNDKSN
jgi:hypothetical protein